MDEQSMDSPGADDFLVVDCLLPGQIRKMGRSLTYLTPRRPIKTTAEDCEIRGGEYVAYDRSNYATSLKVWLPQAKAGDKVAQTYVGEIFEKGLGLASDYSLAADWYKKAAEQGHAPAQINLGYLYEKGLGVEKDPVTALNWYRKASGMEDAITLDPGTINVRDGKELEELRREIELRKRESDSMRKQLEQNREQLEKYREELKQRKGEAETERQELKKARQELEKQQKFSKSLPRSADLKNLKVQLEHSGAALKQKDQANADLYEEIIRLEKDAKEYSDQLEKIKKQQEEIAIAGPAIELIDPPLVATRGVSIVSTKKGMERSIVGRVTAPAGIKIFTVNDRKEEIDEKGLFSLSVMAKGPSTMVRLVAIDNEGKRESVEFQLADKGPSLPKPLKISNKSFGKYYALIIGNKKYVYWPKLRTPVNDATRVAEVLGSKYGFKTTLLLDATRSDILRALNEFRKNLTEKDNLLIYYAGHGNLEEKINRGYWIPIDAEQDNDVEWIPTYAVTDVLGIMSAKHVLVVSDSCYSGAFTRSSLARLEAGKTKEARNEWIRIMSGKRSRTVLTSGDLKPVLDSGGGDHSVFAKAFLDVLLDNSDILEGQRLYQEVAARVAYAASAEMVEQVPQYAPIKFAGYESGDFFFVPFNKN